MVNKYYQKNKKSFGKKHVKYIKISLKNKNTKGEQKPEKDIKILLKKKKKGISIIKNVRTSYPSIE